MIRTALVLAVLVSMTLADVPSSWKGSPDSVIVAAARRRVNRRAVRRGEPTRRQNARRNVTPTQAAYRSQTTSQG